MLKVRLIGGIQSLMLIGALFLGACGAEVPDLTPTVTVDPNEIRTQAVSTFAADLTATAFAAPTDTPVPTQTPAPTLATLATSTGGVAFGVTAPASGGAAGCYSLTYVDDVTIDDNTQVDPGETFTKTWKVLNSGTCAWDAGFKFSFVSGDSMSGGTYTLPSSIAAGATTDISVEMKAPNKSGTIRGDWQMYTASGQAVPGGVYVQVVVGGAATSAATTAVPTTAVPAVTTAVTQ
jgi:hypothetical protein